eukprot:GGOE01005162.1.p1 GENE.GGOE01005162.1~~GGOE01005162.1.p1  ORF type:complete len:185 (-),score=15.11 GGOE01005162.1:272-826(-)
MGWQDVPHSEGHPSVSNDLVALFASRRLEVDDGGNGPHNLLQHSINAMEVGGERVLCKDEQAAGSQDKGGTGMGRLDAQLCRAQPGSEVHQHRAGQAEDGHTMLYSLIRTWFGGCSSSNTPASANVAHTAANHCGMGRVMDTCSASGAEPHSCRRRHWRDVQHASASTQRRTEAASSCVRKSGT